MTTRAWGCGIVLSLVAFAGVGSTGWAAGTGAAAGLCASSQKMQGFTTCADIAAAEREGEVVLYAPDVEQGMVMLLETFHALFPKIKTNYVRLQSGALYAKVQAERQARTYAVDVLNLTDMGLVLDFEKRNGYQRYISPEMRAYKPEYKSQPEGYWTWGSVLVSGISYNPKIVPREQAPKGWEDLLDPRWTGVINVKTANSGSQHVTWYMLTKELGAEYWQKFAQLRPVAFDSLVQQFDRLINGQDKVAECATYSAYLQYKIKGAPVEFVQPARGMPAGAEVYGIAEHAPHPNAARLFLDWFLSPLGQQRAGQAFFLHPPRTDVPPPAGGAPTGELKLLFPSDWQDFLASRAAFTRQWETVLGRR